ncbi:SURF1 family protein [Methylomarinum sp. Ch1-1]|uniref:SURF1-like protein n=1 Tax=Methylomarinum roseum TaxID=3067653 RepID=A0AAU7NP98_9GAMM
MKKLNISLAGRSFRFSIGGLLLYLIAVTVLCALGNWQLRRAEQKALFLQQQEVASEAEISDLNRQRQLDLKALEYQTVSVSGYYDPLHQFLIDNQISRGKAGYFVMTPFFIEGRDVAVLVNRGWVPMAQDRSLKTDISIEEANTTITGRVNHFPPVGLVLEGADVPSASWPAVVQVVNSEILAKRLGYPLLDFQVELDPEMTDGYRREWRSVSVMPPEKHIAYAVQWFALALTLTVLFIWLSHKK